MKPGQVRKPRRCACGTKCPSGRRRRRCGECGRLFNPLCCGDGESCGPCYSQGDWIRSSHSMNHGS